MVMLITPKKKCKEARERKLAWKSDCEKRQRLSQTFEGKMAVASNYFLEELAMRDVLAMLIMANQYATQQKTPKVY